MNYFKNIVYLSLFTTFIFSCKSVTEDVSAKVDGLGGIDLPKTPLDNWLSDNFTKTYNIEVKYRWDAYELPLNKTLVPPVVTQIQPTMEAVKAIWIEPYVKEAGADFIKKFCPKQYVLVGSANWNSNGTIILGTAEGGRKVVLYQINEFNKKNIAGVQQMLHTIHHEFGHILHQNILYPLEFKQITPGTYTSNWYNISEDKALKLGYISSYAMSAPDEDFVEMLSIMLVFGKGAFDTRVNALTDVVAKNALRKKEQIVVDYLTKTYKINFRSLQTTTQTAIANFTK